MGKTNKLREITAYLDALLNIGGFAGDHSNNGLQFEGKSEVGRIAFGVDASAEFFRRAAEARADMVFVHHGLSWGSSLKRITGIDARRIALLATNGLSLYAAHLPLDAHPGIGHNALLSAMAGLQYTAPFGEYDGLRIGFRGELPGPAAVGKLAEKFDSLLPAGGTSEIFGDRERRVSRIGIISGGGAFPAVFSEMETCGLGCLVCGEMSHESVNYALEAGVCVLRLGHYRSETPGVLAVMDDLKRYFGLDVEFIDLPTGF